MCCSIVNTADENELQISGSPLRAPECPGHGTVWQEKSIITRHKRKSGRRGRNEVSGVRILHGQIWCNDDVDGMIGLISLRKSKKKPDFSLL